MSIIMILLISAFIFGIVKFSSFKRSTYLSGNKAIKILGGYILILVVCTAVISLLPAKEETELKKVDFKNVEKKSTELTLAVSEKRMKDVDPSFIAKRWNLNYTGSELYIETQNGETLNTRIIFEKKKSNDSKIEVIFYRTISTMNDWEITKLKKIPRVTLNGDTLTLQGPKKFTRDFYQFQNPFPIAQFKKEHLFNHTTSFYEGPTVIYILVPKDLEFIDKTNGSIEVF